MPISQDARVALEFVAETKRARDEIKKLADSMTKGAKAASDAGQKQQKSLEDQVLFLGKVTAGAAAAVGAYQTLSESIDMFQKRSQLQAAAAGKDIDRIVAASGGLLTKMQALELAARGSTSAFKSNQAELELMAKLFRKLVRDGNDVTESFEEIRTAAIEANTEGLKKLGTQIKAEADTMQGYTDLMRGAIEATRDLGGASATTAESIQASKSSYTNAINDLKIALGELATKLEPVAELITRIVQKVAEAANYLIPDTSGAGGMEQLKELQAERARVKGIIKRITAPGVPLPHEGGVYDTYQAALRELERIEEELPGMRRLARVDRRARVRVDNMVPHGPAEETAKERYQRLKDDQKEREDALNEYQKALERYQEIARKAREKADQTMREYQMRRGQKKDSAFTSLGQSLEAGPTLIGGALSDSPIAGMEVITRDFEEATKVVTGLESAFDTLEQTAVSALKTLSDVTAETIANMIAGADSGTLAWHKLAAGIMKAIGTQLLGIAIKEGVLAAASAAGLDVGGAARHASAAKIATLGAAGVGALVASNLIGGGGTGTVTRAPGVPSVAGAGAGSSVTIFVGSDFADNDRARAQRARRAFERGRQAAGDESVLSFG